MPWLLLLGIGLVALASRAMGASNPQPKPLLDIGPAEVKPAKPKPIPAGKFPKRFPGKGRYQVVILDPTSRTYKESYTGDDQEVAGNLLMQWSARDVSWWLFDNTKLPTLPVRSWGPATGPIDWTKEAWVGGGQP